MTRVRVRFTKLGKVRWTSHRDVARMWERALRRAELPVAYTEGFTPRPKVSFGLALPTGHESVAEYLDLELATGRRRRGRRPGRAVVGRSCPTGSTSWRPPVLDDRAASLQEDGHRRARGSIACRARRPRPARGRDAAVERRWPPTRSSSTRSARART